MPVPDRPVTLTTIASEWGQEVHDRVFAPKGCKVSGTAITMAGAGAQSTLDLSTAVDDPGGWLGTDELVVPDEAEGLYTVSLRCNTVDGASDKTRIFLRVNGAEVARGIEDNSGSTNVPLSVSTHLELVATDSIDVRAQQVGSGARADVRVVELSLIRIGAEYGA